MSQFFVTGSQNIEVSASASVLPMTRREDGHPCVHLLLLRLRGDEEETAGCG